MGDALSLSQSQPLTHPPGEPFRLPLPFVFPEYWIFRLGPPAVPVLLLSLRLSRNSQGKFPRFLTVPTHQHFVADICVSATVASTSHPRTFRSQTLGNDYLCCTAPSVLAASLGFSWQNLGTSSVSLVSSSDKSPERPATSR